MLKVSSRVRTMAVVTTTSIGTALTNGRNREDNSRNKKKDDTGGKKNNCKDKGKWYLHKAEGDTIFLLRDFAVKTIHLRR